MPPATAIPRSISASRAWLRALEMTAKIERTLPVAVEEQALKSGDALALLSAHGSLSYAGLVARARRISRWALAQGLQKGDVVCLFMRGSPDYIALWLGLTRIGVVCAFLNTNLASAGLVHAIRAAGSRRAVADETGIDALTGARAHLETPFEIFRFGEMGLADFSGEKLEPHETCDIALSDRALLIYTSGTTGLPKAAAVSHGRMMMWSRWFAGMIGASSADRLYNCLPLYHSIGGVVANGAMLAVGGSVVLREKFSASAFWDDIVRWDCTVFQYIGELCRYLLASPSEPKAHKLRLACGNGLGGDIWERFKTRFAIPQILEFYAATEGNFSLYNAEGEVGAIGRIPPFLAHRFGVEIVKYDLQTGEVARGADGFCIACARGEVGEAIARITPMSRFEGYTDEAAGERKILRNAFARGDAWLHSGDLMRMDERGFFYFVDRAGDTFRWKGENVATREVAEAIMEYPGIRAAAVYGVAVPGADGKAGMAALTTESGFDGAGLRAHLAARLPDYARPIFLRVTQDLVVTETFKPKKNQLQSEGFDPSRIRDAIYVDDGACYVPLDAAGYTRINSGRTRL